MKFLFDSHTLLWAVYAPELLAARVQAALSDSRNEMFISHVSPWELTDKAAKFRLPLAGSSPDTILREMRELKATFLAIELEDVIESVKLPRHHNDPFDRLLIAQARRIGATLLSVDGKFKHYDVPVMWN